MKKLFFTSSIIMLTLAVNVSAHNSQGLNTGSEFYYEPYSFIDSCGCKDNSYPGCTAEFIMLESKDLTSAISEFKKKCLNLDNLVLQHCYCRANQTQVNAHGVIDTKIKGSERKCSMNNAILSVKESESSFKSLLNGTNYTCKPNN